MNNLCRVANWYEIESIYDEYVRLYANEIIDWFNKTMGILNQQILSDIHGNSQQLLG